MLIGYTIGVRPMVVLEENSGATTDGLGQKLQDTATIGETQATRTLS